MYINSTLCESCEHYSTIFLADLAPVATKGVVVPAPGLEESPTPSLPKASLAPATASPVLAPAATNPAPAL